jgi:hypothetical protein
MESSLGFSLVMLATRAVTFSCSRWTMFDVSYDCGLETNGHTDSRIKPDRP